MFEFMVNNSKVGAYQTAFNHSLKLFANKDPLEMAKASGAHFDTKESTFTLTSLGQTISLHYPSGKAFFTGKKDSPLWQWSLIVLNYLARSNNTPLTNQLISYRELEDGNVFYPAFFKNAIKPLTQLSDNSIVKIKRNCNCIAGKLEKGADLAIRFNFLPNFPISLRVWQGDEEVPASANLLFDSSANNYLHTEDIAVAGELVSNFLLKLIKTV